MFRIFFLRLCNGVKTRRAAARWDIRFGMPNAERAAGLQVLLGAGRCVGEFVDAFVVGIASVGRHFNEYGVALF